MSGVSKKLFYMDWSFESLHQYHEGKVLLLVLVPGIEKLSNYPKTSQVMNDEVIVQLIYKDSSTHPHFPVSVSDSRLEIHWPCRTASPKPQILMPTHRVRVTLVVMGILRLAPLPSRVTSNLISRMWTLLIFNLCKNHSSPLSLLMTAIAGHMNLTDLAWFGLPESPVQRFESLHWMAWHTEIQTHVVSPKTPRVNMCQSQNFFLIEV